MKSKITFAYVKVIRERGVSNFGCESHRIKSGIYMIVKNKYYDTTDKAAQWDFEPGDLVRCKYEYYNGLNNIRFKLMPD